MQITISDPDTIQAIQRYALFVETVDGVTGTIDQLAEGLILGMLDEHWQFRAWCTAAADAVQEVRL